jgi:8-oxo-dGTP pyrophosphatase MutT (NUDIX family)
MKLTDLIKAAAPRYVDDPNWSTDQNVHWGNDGSGCLLICSQLKLVFLLKRSSEVTEPNTWGIPGGARPIDKKTNRQKPSLANAITETREEVGGIPPGFNRYKDKVTYRGSGFKYDTFVVDLPASTVKSWRPKLDWENSDWGWFRMDSLPKPLHFGVKWLFKNYNPFGVI